MRFHSVHLREGVQIVRRQGESGNAIGPYFVFGPKDHEHFYLMTGSTELMRVLLEPYEVDTVIWMGEMQGVDDELKSASEVIREIKWRAKQEPDNSPNGRIIAGAQDVLEVFCPSVFAMTPT